MKNIRHKQTEYCLKASLVFVCTLLSLNSYSQACSAPTAYTTAVNINPCGGPVVSWTSAVPGTLPASATIPSTANNYTDYLDIATPTAAASPTVIGVAVCIEASGLPNTSIEGVQLLQEPGSVPIGTVMGPTVLAAGLTWYGFGGCHDLWGNAPGVLTSTNIGVRIWLGQNCGVAAAIASIAKIQAIQVNIYQTAACLTVATCASCTPTVLPIQLSSFMVTPSADQVDIAWTTASENNNALFTVERSDDGENWQIVTKHPGAGNSVEPVSYTAVDKTPFLGISYYRLKQTDYDGDATYSGAYPVDVTEPVGHMLLYPNPATTKIHCNLPTGNPGLQTVRIIDVTGRVIMNSQIMVPDNGQIDINIANLQSGMYVTEIENGEQVMRKTFIKQ